MMLPGFMLSTISSVMSTGAGPARNQRGGDHDVLLRQVLGPRAWPGGGGSPRSSPGRSRPRSPPPRVSSLSTITNEAPRLSTCSFTAGRTSVALTMAPSRRAVAIACSPCHPGPEHEHPCRGHRAGRGHHHRHRPRELRRGVDHRLVAREVRLRGEDVHRLRAADPRHELHREGVDARRGVRIHRVPGAVGREHSDERRPRLHRGKLRIGRRPDLQHQVRAGTDSSRRRRRAGRPPPRTPRPRIPRPLRPRARSRRPG